MKKKNQNVGTKSTFTPKFLAFSTPNTKNYIHEMCQI